MKHAGGIGSDGGDPFATTPVLGDIYTPAGLEESLPGVIPPLLWTINAPMLDDAFRRVLGGSGPARGFAFLGRFRSRAALNLSAVRRAFVAGGMPPDEVDHRYLGRVLPHHAGAAVPTRRRRAGGRADGLRRLADEVEMMAEAAHRISSLGIDPDHMSTGALVAYLAQLRNLAWRCYAAGVAASARSHASYRRVEENLGRWLGSDAAAPWAQALCAVATVPTPATASMAIYGGVAWDEVSDAPAPPTPGASGGADAARREALARLRQDLGRSWTWRAQRLLTGQLVDLRVRTVERGGARAAHFLQLREEAKVALLTLGGEERRMLLESGGRLAAQGSLPSARDVELLSADELEAMLAGAAPPGDLAERRVRLASDRAAPPLPEWFQGDASRAPKRAPVAGGRVLTGWPASSGRARGRARLVVSPEAGNGFRPGDVLVAHSTDPSWTPLLITAGAIVAEVGSPLSHAAIIAREHGIPAVLSVTGIASVLAEGEQVEVDGTAGEVRRGGLTR